MHAIDPDRRNRRARRDPPAFRTGRSSAGRRAKQDRVDAEIQAALIHHEGKLGEVLECVIAYQQGKWEKALDTGLNPDIVREAFLESLDWSVTVSSLL